jgi:hypothetical protein
MPLQTHNNKVWEYNSRHQVWRELQHQEKWAARSTGKFSGKGTEVPSSIGFKSKYK